MSFRWISRDGVLPKTRGLFWSYLFWGSAKWHSLVQNILNWLVNWFLNLLVRNVIEREIEREKVQMKPPKISSPRSWKCCTRLCKILIFISKLSYESLWKSWNVFENHLNKEFFQTTKFLVDNHKIVAQDYVQSSNFDSNINYLL